MIIGFPQTNQNVPHLLLWFYSDFETITVCIRSVICTLIAKFLKAIPPRVSLFPLREGPSIVHNLDDFEF